jgi:hypothetical protein
LRSSLLLGFAFAGATSRLDTRRELIIREANAIGTAYLRLDLVPAADQPSLRALFRDYLDARRAVRGCQRSSCFFCWRWRS